MCSCNKTAKQDSYKYRKANIKNRMMMSEGVHRWGFRMCDTGCSAPAAPAGVQTAFTGAGGPMTVECEESVFSAHMIPG